MAMSDLKLNKLRLDTAGCMRAIKDILNIQLDKLSVSLIRIVSSEIQSNGNGSSRMKSRAIWNVKETKREVTSDHVTLEVGINFDDLKKDEELFVCVSVVLHGNMNGSTWTWRDAQVMYTKPGQETYGKHVTDKRVHVPEWYTPRALPGFAQQDVSREISMNVEKEINRYVGNYMDSVARAIDAMDWSAFLIVR